MINFTLGFIFGFLVFSGLYLFARSAFIAEVAAKAKQKEQQARTQSILATKADTTKYSSYETIKDLADRANEEKQKLGKASDETVRKIYMHFLKMDIDKSRR